MSEEQWGPWIDNPGIMPVSGCTIVQIEIRRHYLWDSGDLIPNGNPDCDRADMWAWIDLGDDHSDAIIRYRIRKPRGLSMLEEIARDVRKPVDA